RTMSIHKERGELSVGYSDNMIRVFDLESLQMKYEWKAHDNSVFTVRYSPNGNYLMTGSRDARLQAWDVNANYRQADEVVAHVVANNHMTVRPDAKHFVRCGADESNKVRDTEE